MNKVRNSQGFTLIELMIVVVIIGILAAIAIPRFTEVSDSAKQAEAAPVLRQICTLAEADRMRSSTGEWPDGDLTTITGWDDPDAEYFTFAYNGDGTATANTTTAGLVAQTMNCEDRSIS